MSFMISRETENVESISEVESAFQALTSGGDKPYVTKDEIFQVISPISPGLMEALFSGGQIL